MTEETMIAISPVGPVITMGQFGLSDGDYQRLRVRLDLFDETIYMTRYNEAGTPVSCYEIDPADLASSFSGLPITTGLLPSDTLFYQRVGNQVRMAIFIPARKYTLVSTTRKTPYRIPLPPLVWVGEGTQYRCYAAKQRPGKEQRLYRFPGPNVFTGRGQGDGRVCQGNVPFPACSADTIKAAFKAFIGSQFNAHLVGHKSTEFDDDIMKRWRQLERAKADAFPLDDLVSTTLQMSDLLQGEGGEQ